MTSRRKAALSDPVNCVRFVSTGNADLLEAVVAGQ